MKFSKAFLFFCFVSIILPNTTIAQSQLSDFLLAAFEDINTYGFTQAKNYITPRNYRIPVIDEIEIRFSNDEFIAEEQQYAFRVSPSNPWKVRRNKALFNATKTEIGLQQKLMYKQNMYNRYLVASSYLLDLKQLELETERYNLTRKRATIIGDNAESSFFDSEDYVESKLDQIDKLYELQEQQTSLLHNKRTIASLMRVEDLNWDNEVLVSVTTIDSVANRIAQRNFNSAELNLLVQSLDVARKETRIEKADFNLGFVQAEYMPLKNRESDIGISFGITIPIFNPNKNKVAERIIKEIEIENQIQTQEFQDSVNKVIQYGFLLDLLKNHQLLEQQIEQIDIPSLIKNLSVNENNNPVTLLDIEEALIKLKLLKFESHKRMVEQYVEFLNAFDMLSTTPLINYLSDSLTPIR